MKKWMKLMLLAVVPAMVLTSCDDDDDTPTIETASVMVVHASPDAPGVDLLVDDNKVNNAALTFPNNTGYLDVRAGRRNVKVNAAGTNTSVINANVDLERDKNYSVFAVNTLASGIEALVLEDNLTAPASGNAHVRFVHLSPDAPAVDIAVTGGPVLFPNVAFKGSTAFTPVAAGTYNLEVRLAGTETVVLPLPGVQIAAGRILTVFARGFVNPPADNNNGLGAEIIVNQ